MKYTDPFIYLILSADAPRCSWSCIQSAFSGSHSGIWLSCLLRGPCRGGWLLQGVLGCYCAEKRKQKAKECVLECEGSNHKVLFFKWHHSSKWICEANFVLLKKQNKFNNKKQKKGDDLRKMVIIFKDLVESIWKSSLASEIKHLKS